MGIIVIFAMVVFVIYHKFLSGSSDEKSTPVESDSPAPVETPKRLRDVHFSVFLAAIMAFSKRFFAPRLKAQQVSEPEVVVDDKGFISSEITQSFDWVHGDEFDSPAYVRENARLFVSSTIIQIFDWIHGDTLDSPAYIRKNVQNTEPGDKIPGSRRYRARKSALKDLKFYERISAS